MGNLEFNELIGMTEDEGREHLSENGLTMRVVNRNGNELMVTQDMRMNRVNVVVVDEKISDVRGVG